MPRFARIADDTVVEIIEIPDGEALADRFHADLVAACLPAGAEVQPGWTWNGSAFAAPAPPPPLPAIRRIAPLAFRRRLGSAKRAAITLAAAAAMEGGDATLQVFLDDLAASRVVELDHPDTVAGVAAMQAAGLITATEAAALLADGAPDEVT